MSVEPQRQHHWPQPPPGGYTADDLDRLPDLPPHTELIDGSLVFMSPQTVFHTRTMRLLENGILRTAPEDLETMREVTVVLGERQRPEPDLIVIPARAVAKPDQTAFRPEDVILAVEVVSDDSKARDRETKPLKYAKAGIPHFWRVESDNGRPVVYVYERDPATGAYVATGIHHNRLKLSVPFTIDIDLTGATRP
ncbi:Uma2 family endonuclease [Streptomyces sp. F63]|uniref:Uma2 family endonuclease n=1 Tax=Streptomyces sp. F63 TaxID=2824887 RepID=UPI001B37D1B2|nr:Uma2 family endonuclease [Streptomyces sp. F63]MBQ0986039.1 Uma2 family endonuclease [Streptomyces sp. F63]